MRLSDVGPLIDIAVENGPPAELLKWYGDYYQPYYHLMYLLARGTTKGIAVELGVHNGRGAVSLAAARPETRVIGLDNHHHPEINKLSGKFDNFTFLHRPSLPVPTLVSQISNRSNGIAILHIDTEHSYSMAKAEFEAYEPLLTPGAVVLFDDLHAQEDDVLEYFSSLPYPKIQDDRLHPVCGYGVLIYHG
ncbi:MAG: class I SAM-dependent methyltransferase [Planctomycetota bacterium]|jgi:cephalosporin hydroxylase